MILAMSPAASWALLGALISPLCACTGFLALRAHRAMTAQQRASERRKLQAAYFARPEMTLAQAGRAALAAGNTNVAAPPIVDVVGVSVCVPAPMLQTLTNQFAPKLPVACAIVGTCGEALLR